MKIFVKIRSQFLFCVSLGLWGQGGLYASQVTHGLHAPRGEAWPSAWAAGNKQLFGTSYESYDKNGKISQQSSTAPVSKIWFTGAQGVLSEVFWPTLDRKQIRDMQFLVSDDKGFFVEERTQTKSRVEWLVSGVPAYRVITHDEARNFEIEKIIFSDPSRDVLLVDVRFKPFKKGLRLHVLLNPALANTPLGDSAEAAQIPFQRLWAWQDQDALSLVSSLPFSKLSAGFSGSLDPFQEIKRNGRLLNTYQRAWDGDVVLAGEIPLRSDSETQFTLALGFGASADQAHEVAHEALNNLQSSLNLYSEQWTDYLSKLRMPQQATESQHKLYRASVAVLKSLEDKTFEGAFIASPSVPWGLHKLDSSREAAMRHNKMTRAVLPAAQSAKGIGGYHLVWPRDLYQMAESFVALGDHETARASLRYLRQIQYREGEGYWDYGNGRRFPKAGAFLQNAWLHGEAHWRMLQVDQTSYPVLLALKLEKNGVVASSEVSEMIFAGANFLANYGPWTFQERWEENMGVAPSTLAVQIAALRESAQFADKLMRFERARYYRSKADAWDHSLEKWTFTDSGPKGNGKYFLRIVGTNSPVDPWNPNSNNWIPITNGAPPLLEKSVLDGGFLELVRLGVRKATDYFIRETLPEYDANLRVSTPQGWGFYRYTGDYYNWDEESGVQTRGMIWPFLSAERARYEMFLAQEQGTRSTDNIKPYLKSFEAFATPSLMLPEQVWDQGSRVGTPTGAATPLGWAHGEFIRILLEYEDFKNNK